MDTFDAAGRAIFARDRGYCQYCGKDLLEHLSDWLAAGVDTVDADAGLDGAVLVCAGCRGQLANCGASGFDERQNWLLERTRHHLTAWIGWKRELR